MDGKYFEGIVKGKSDKAALVDIDGQEVWIPWDEIIPPAFPLKEDLPLNKNCEIGDEVWFYIPNWLAHKEGLI